MDITVLIEKNKQIAEKLEDLNSEISNNPDVPQEVKDKLTEIRIASDRRREESLKYLEENKHRKIVGYNPETFEPIFED
jgi:hypothetical protein